MLIKFVNQEVTEPTESILKRWDIIPVLEPKSYDHIEELINQVFHYRSTSVDVVRARVAPKPPTHPEMIHQTTAPPPTSEISEKKKSRFANFKVLTIDK